MIRAILTCFGLGLLKPAPGTWGSLPPVVLALVMAMVLEQDGWTAGDAWMLNAIIAFFGLFFAIACVRFGDRAEAMFKRKDPPEVVADEAAGQSLALLGLPWFWGDGWWWNISIALIAFFAFRVFDIIKPQPAERLQSLRGGLGILLDDLVAGVYAGIIAQAIVRIVLAQWV